MHDRLARHVLPPLLASALLLLGACNGTSPDTATTGSEEEVAPMLPGLAAPDGPHLPGCDEAGGLIPVAIWRATIDANRTLSSAPPRQDGIIELALSPTGLDVTCTGSGPHLFRGPQDPSAPARGNLPVRIDGEAGDARGACVISGYYLGSARPEGEIHLSRVDDAQVIASGRYCAQG